MPKKEKSRSSGKNGSYNYVIDDNNKLTGTLSLRLLLADSKTFIKNLKHRDYPVLVEDNACSCIIINMT